MNRGCAFLAAMIIGCSDPNAAPVREGGLDWEPCPLFYEGRANPEAQCATLNLPLRWDEPDGPEIELFVQRRLTSDDSGRQLWMLAGGPGQTAAVYETFVKDLDGKVGETDFYLYEHRGVGRSTRLGCAAEEADGSDGGIDVTDEEWPSCLADVEATWGSDLEAFSVDEAAHDVFELTDRMRGDRSVFVYGASYGTTLGHRFLQLHPDAVDGVILDSLALDVDHRVYDAEFDQVGGDFLELCAADERCAEALGPLPRERAAEILDGLPDGPCAEVIDATTLRAGVGSFLADASLRGYAPALLHRVGRCTDDDIADIERLIGLFVDREPHYTERLYSPVLFSNIELSEQWPEPWPTQEELDAAQVPLIFSLGLSTDRRFLLDLWPRYPLPAHAGQLAETATPLLLLQGGLDPQTPPWRADAARAHFDGPGQHFVDFPQGAHVLLGSTPARGGDCATQMLSAFLDDPLADPDTSCVEMIEPIDFTGQPLVSQLLLTDWSRYGNGCGGRAQDVQAAMVCMLWLGLRRRRARTGGR